MAQTVGHITELNGVFFVKGTNGDTRVLKVGDELFIGETIVGDSANGTDSMVKFAVDGSDKEYTVVANNQLSLDSTMLPSELASENVVQPEDLEEALMLDATYDQAEAAPVAGDEVATAEDIEDLEETAAAGDAEVDALTGRFIDRTGDETDVTTTLRDATFTDPVLDEEETVAEPILENAVLTLDDVTVYEGSGTATIAASLDYVTDTQMIVTLDNGATITFEAGSKTATSTPFSIQSDDVHNDGETYTVSVSGTTGGNFENLLTTDTAQVTVNDTIDDTTLTLDDVTVYEGSGTATIAASLDNATDTAMTVTL
ncbi:MAG: immunoglobulin-like domain-containing protein, partial [Campylobacterota bacterium]|nr:immunoglobulin-like domain-containing protein [Campylobacterota bacterium]